MIVCVCNNLKSNEQIFLNVFLCGLDLTKGRSDYIWRKIRILFWTSENSSIFKSPDFDVLLDDFGFLVDILFQKEISRSP